MDIRVTDNNLIEVKESGETVGIYHPAIAECIGQDFLRAAKEAAGNLRLITPIMERLLGLELTPAQAAEVKRMVDARVRK